jgi:hypothetical protein
MKAIISFLLFPALATIATAGSGTLSVSPAVVTLQGSFGQSTTQKLTLTNNTSQLLSFDLMAADVVVENGRRSFVPAGNISDGIAARAVFQPSSVTVPAGRSVTVQAAFTIPNNTSQRAVAAVFKAKTKLRGNERPVLASIGTLLTFTLSADVRLSTEDLAVQSQTVSSNLSIAQACRNSGREPLMAKGMLAIISEAGQIVGRSPIEARRLLPGEATTMKASYGGELAPGHYRTLVTYEFDGRSVTSEKAIDVQ